MDFVSWSWGFEFGFRVSGLGVCVGFMFFFSGSGVCVSGFVVSKVCGVSGIEFSVSGLVGCDVSGLGSSVCIFWSRAFCVGVGFSACLVSGFLVSDFQCGFWSRVFCLSFFVLGIYVFSCLLCRIFSGGCTTRAGGPASGRAPSCRAPTPSADLRQSHTAKVLECSTCVEFSRVFWNFITMFWNVRV